VSLGRYALRRGKSYNMDFGLEVSGWRESSWAGFGHQFSDPAPQYFRTLETGCTVFSENGFILTKVIEPISTQTQISASVIFVDEDDDSKWFCEG